LKDCTIDDFRRTENTMNFYLQTVKLGNLNLTCFSEEGKNMLIEGNVQDKKVYKKTNSYFSVQIFRCSGSKCATPKEIDDWLYSKQLEPISINTVPELKSFEKPTFNEFSQYKGIKLAKGIKTDYWFRFKLNTYKRRDFAIFSPLKVDSFPSIHMVYDNDILVPEKEAE